MKLLHLKTDCKISCSYVDYNANSNHFSVADKCHNLYVRKCRNPKSKMFIMKPDKLATGFLLASLALTVPQPF